DAGHTLVLIVEDDDSLQALNAFVIVDATIPPYGADLTVIPTMLARLAAGIDALEPGEQPQATEHCQPGAQRADVAAIELVHEQPKPEQRQRIEHERPGAHEEQRDAGLERLHLR